MHSDDEPPPLTFEDEKPRSGSVRSVFEQMSWKQVLLASGVVIIPAVLINPWGWFIVFITTCVGVLICLKRLALRQGYGIWPRLLVFMIPMFWVLPLLPTPLGSFEEESTQTIQAAAVDKRADEQDKVAREQARLQAQREKAANVAAAKKKAEQAAALRQARARAARVKAAKARAARLRAARLRKQRQEAQRKRIAQERAAREARAAAEHDNDLDLGYPQAPPYPPDVNCSDLDGPVVIVGDDPHDLDRDNDGIGCEDD